MKTIGFISRTIRRTDAPPSGARLRSLLCAALALGLALTTTPAYAAHAAAHASSKERSHGYLGIEFRDTSDEQAAAMHLTGPRGAEIMMVDHDGPAGKAGLQPHDVVLQIDGQNIDAAEDLSKRIRESAAGRVISLSIMRLGRALTLTAKLADQKELERNSWMKHLTVRQPDDDVENILIQRYKADPVPAPKQPSRGQSFIGTVLHTAPYTGASLDTMEPQLASFFGAPPKTGLLVHGVDANSPASIAGLRAGDVVLRMDSAAVASTSDWTKHVRGSKGKPLSLTVLRDRHELTLSMTPDPKRHSEMTLPVLGFVDPTPLVCELEYSVAVIF